MSEFTRSFSSTSFRKEGQSRVSSANKCESNTANSSSAQKYQHNLSAKEQLEPMLFHKKQERSNLKSAGGTSQSLSQSQVDPSSSGQQQSQQQQQNQLSNQHVKQVYSTAASAIRQIQSANRFALQQQLREALQKANTHHNRSQFPSSTNVNPEQVLCINNLHKKAASISNTSSIGGYLLPHEYITNAQEVIAAAAAIAAGNENNIHELLQSGRTTTTATTQTTPIIPSQYPIVCPVVRASIMDSLLAKQTSIQQQQYYKNNSQFHYQLQQQQEEQQKLQQQLQQQQQQIAQIKQTQQQIASQQNNQQSQQQNVQVQQSQKQLQLKPLLNSKYSILKSGQSKPIQKPLVSETLSRSASLYPTQVVKSPSSRCGGITIPSNPYLSNSNHTNANNNMNNAFVPNGQNNIHQPQSVLKICAQFQQTAKQQFRKKKQQHLKLVSQDEGTTIGMLSQQQQQQQSCFGDEQLGSGDNTTGSQVTSNKLEESASTACLLNRSNSNNNNGNTNTSNNNNNNNSNSMRNHHQHPYSSVRFTQSMWSPSGDMNRAVSFKPNASAVIRDKSGSNHYQYHQNSGPSVVGVGQNGLAIGSDFQAQLYSKIALDKMMRQVSQAVSPVVASESSIENERQSNEGKQQLFRRQAKSFKVMPSKRLRVKDIEGIHSMSSSQNYNVGGINNQQQTVQLQQQQQQQNQQQQQQLPFSNFQQQSFSSELSQSINPSIDSNVPTMIITASAGNAGNMNILPPQPYQYQQYQQTTKLKQNRQKGYTQSWSGGSGVTSYGGALSSQLQQQLAVNANDPVQDSNQQKKLNDVVTQRESWRKRVGANDQEQYYLSGQSLSIVAKGEANGYVGTSGISNSTMAMMMNTMTNGGQDGGSTTTTNIASLKRIDDLNNVGYVLVGGSSIKPQQHYRAASSEIARDQIHTASATGNRFVRSNIKQNQFVENMGQTVGGFVTKTEKDEQIDQLSDSVQPWSRRGSELDISIF